MTCHLWKLEYNGNLQGTQFFYVSYMQWFEFGFLLKFILLYLISIVVISFMLHQCHKDINNGIPWGMKSYPTQFMRFPYYEVTGPKNNSFVWYNAYREECDRSIMENHRW